MTIEESLRSAKGQELIGKVAEAFDVDEQKAGAAVQSLTDELKVRIQRSMLSRGGVADVVSLVTAPSAAKVLSNPDDLSSPDVAASGNQILDVLIGSKHVSRGIAARTASDTGLDADTVQKILPVVANLLIGELQRQSGPAITKVAGNIPGFSGAGGSPLPLPGDTFPPAGPAEETTPDYRPTPPEAPSAPRGPIDAGRPLPIPGDNIPGLGRSNRYPGPDDNAPEDNPYSRLPDIVRRGGQRVPGPDGGSSGSLEDIIRSILGNLLGSNSGVIGTMIKLFLVRWLVSFLRRILSGAAGSR